MTPSPQLAPRPCLEGSDAREAESAPAINVGPCLTVTEAELIAYCRERIAHSKAPKSVDFANELPCNASGKLLKHVLRALYWEGREQQVTDESQ